MSTKYLYYCLSNEQQKIYDTKKGGGVPHVHISDIDTFEVPLPALPVQREIVRLLDEFSLLSAELAAELAARKQQYEYYKDHLLPFEKEDVKWLPLGEISTIVRGASPRPIKNYVTNSSYGVNWIKIGDVKPGDKYITETEEKITLEGSKKSRFVHPGDFILSNSMSYGRPYILKIDGCIHDGWLSISEFNQHVTSDYLYHVLTSNYIQKIMKQKASFGGAVQNLNADIVRSIEIPIPSLDEQNKIVDVLDRFSLLCTDILSGLPAEIEARQKQFKYYRNKLLTFNRLES